MTVAVDKSGRVISVSGVLAEQLVPGGPATPFTFTTEVLNGSLYITLDTVPAEMLTWRALVRVLSDSGPRGFYSPHRIATTEPTEAESLFDMTGGLLGRREYANASILVTVVPFDAEARAGRPMPPVVLDIDVAPIAVETVPTIGGVTVGAVSTATPPDFNIEANLVYLTRRLQFRATLVAEWADVDLETNPTYDVIIPLAHLDGYRRHVYDAVGPLGDELEVATAAVGPVVQVSVGTPARILPEDVTFGATYFAEVSNTWCKARVFVDTYPLNTNADVEMRCTFTDPDVYPSDPIVHAGAWETMAPMPSSTTDRTPMMTDGSKNTPGSTPRVDYTSWEVSSPAMERLRLSVRTRTAGVWSDWSPVSPPMTIPQPVVTPPSGDTDLWRQDMLRHATALGLPADLPDNASFGLYGMDGSQYMPCGAVSADGLFLVMGQDSAGIRVSFGGLAWYIPDNQGMKLFQMIGCYIDPEVIGGEYTVYALATPGFLGSYADTYAGLWRSTDSCKSWTQVKALPSSIGDGQWVCQNVTAFPKTGPASARRIFAVAYNEADAQLGLTLYRSTIGGGGPGGFYNLPRTLGIPYCLLAVSDQVLYMGTGTGLYRSVNGGAAWGSPILGGGAVRSLWIDPANSDHQIASVTAVGAGGVYETTNAWASETRILDARVHAIGVGAANASGQRIIYAMITKGTPERNIIYVRKFDGTWIHGTSASTPVQLLRPGVDTTYTPFTGISWMAETPNNSNSMSHGFVLPHPIEPTFCWVFGKTGFWVTTDAGQKWSLSMAGWGGLVRRSLCFDAQPNGSWMKTMAGCHDTGRWVTYDGGRSAKATSLLKALKDDIELVAGRTLPSKTFRGTAMLPDDTTVSAPECRGRFFGGFGQQAQKALVYCNKGEDVLRHILGDNPTVGQTDNSGQGLSLRTWAGYLPHNPNRCFCGPRVSINGTQTWKSVNGTRSVMAHVGDETDNCYSQVSGVIYRGNPFDGAAQSLWFTPVPSTMWIENTDGICAVSKQLGHILIRFTNAQSIRLLKHNGSVGVETTLSFSGLGIPVNSVVSGLDWDPLDPRYVSVGFGDGAMGTDKIIFRGRFNSDWSAIAAWENITANAPKSSHTSQPVTHAWTGDLFDLVSGQGTYIHAAPDDYQPVMGVIKLVGQPANNNTIVVNGVTITFKSSAPGANEVLIGANAAETAVNLKTVLNASGSGSLNICTYSSYEGTSVAAVYVTLDDPPAGVLTGFPMSVTGTPNARLLHPAKINYRAYWARCPLPIYAGVV